MKCVYASASLFSTHIFLSFHLECSSYSRSKTSRKEGQTAGEESDMSSNFPKPRKSMS